MMRKFLFVLFLVFAPLVAAAQTTPTLIADQIVVEPDGIIIARGNVQIWQGDVSITASEIVYNRNTNKLTIQGPILVQDGDRVTVLANEAELDPNLRGGVLRDARFVLDKRLQIAAAELEQSDGRYTQAYKIAATSCHICRGRTPIWQIRAQRMVHDKEEQQIYFENAQVRLFDIPILWLPRVRLPDPSLRRAQGFLTPVLRNNTRLGFGLKVPYFIPIGPHKDITITPYVTTETNTVELRYRQAVRNGEFEFNGALSRDTLLPSEIRGYIIGKGAFELARDYALTFDVKAVTDPTYLSSYRYSDADRLRSRIELSRAQRDKNVELRLSAYHSLRPTDNNANIPSLVAEGILEERFVLPNRRGELGYELSFLGSRRSSDINIDFDGDGEVDGFDVGRVSVQGYWLGSKAFQNGIIADGNAVVDLDAYRVWQHSGFPEKIENASATISGTLRWPLMRKDDTGLVSQIEPILQISHTEGTVNPVPNQDSTRFELDFGNLFADTRAPGHDVKDLGTRLTFGVRGSQEFASGSHLAWQIGKILYDSDANTNFSASSGLDGNTSDWVLETGYRSANGLELMNRVIVAGNGDIQKSDTRFGLARKKTQIMATHTWLEADAAENRPSSISELSLQGSRAIDENWTLAAGLRYDFNSETLSETDVSATFENECIEVQLSASRQYTGVPSTDYGFRVGFRGFGTGPETKEYSHNCGG